MADINQTLIAIAVADIRPHCHGDMPIEDRVRKAMRRSLEFWMSSDDNVRYKAAVLAAYAETSDSEDKRRIEQASRALSAISLAIAGHPIDVAAALPKEGDNVLQLMRIWLEVKDEYAKQG